MFEDAEATMAADATARRFCGFTRWVLTLEPEDRARAERLVADRSWNCRQLARYFQAKGAKVNDQVLTRHRNLACCGQQQ